MMGPTREVQVDAAPLLGVLVRGVYGSATGPTVYRHALLRFDGAGLLSAVTTDTLLERREVIRAAGDEAQAVCADAGKLRAALTGQDGAVLLRADDKGLHVIAGRRRYVVPTLPLGDFPEQQLDGQSVEVECDPEGLANAIRRVQYAGGLSAFAGTVCDSVLLEQNQVVATNGVTFATCPAGLALGDKEQIVIPKSAIKSVLGMLAEGARLSVLRDNAGDAVSAVFERNGVRLVVRLFGERFPAWRAALKRGMGDGVALSTVAFDSPGALAGALARVRAFAEQRNPVVWIEGESGGELRLRPRQTVDTSGEADDMVVCQVQGAVDVGLNAALVGEVLSSAGDSPVTWLNYGPTQVQAWQIEGRQDEHYMMPFRR